MILSVNKIKALDVFLDGLIDKLQRLVNWLGTRQDDLIVNLSYGAAESAAKAVDKLNSRLDDLTDQKYEQAASYIEAVNALKQKYKALEQALTDAHAAKVDAIDAALGTAALNVLAAEDQYEAVVAQVRDELVRKNMAAASAFPWAK